jgi:hypothetical protein
VAGLSVDAFSVWVALDEPLAQSTGEGQMIGKFGNWVNW